jgi:hypothetical protein
METHVLAHEDVMRQVFNPIRLTKYKDLEIDMLLGVPSERKDANADVEVSQVRLLGLGLVSVGVFSSLGCLRSFPLHETDSGAGGPPHQGGFEKASVCETHLRDTYAHVGSGWVTDPHPPC